MQAINQVPPGRLGSCSLPLIPCPWSHTSTPWQLQVTGQHTAELTISCSSRSCNWDGKGATSHYFPSPWLCDAVSLSQRRQRRTEDCNTSSYCSQPYWGLLACCPQVCPLYFPSLASCLWPIGFKSSQDQCTALCHQKITPQLKWHNLPENNDLIKPTVSHACSFSSVS